MAACTHTHTHISYRKYVAAHYLLLVAYLGCDGRFENLLVVDESLFRRIDVQPAVSHVIVESGLVDDISAIISVVRSCAVILCTTSAISF